MPRRRQGVRQGGHRRAYPSVTDGAHHLRRHQADGQRRASWVGQAQVVRRRGRTLLLGARFGTVMMLCGISSSSCSSSSSGISSSGATAAAGVRRRRGKSTDSADGLGGRAEVALLLARRAREGSRAHADALDAVPAPVAPVGATAATRGGCRPLLLLSRRGGDEQQDSREEEADVLHLRAHRTKALSLYPPPAAVAIAVGVRDVFVVV